MGNTQIAKVDVFKNALNDGTVRAQLKNSLKENSGAFMSSMLDLYSGDTYLQSCDPKAVVAECVKAAVLNLPLVKSLGFAYVVPYKNRPTFIIGYKGLIQLAQRTGQYKTINAGVVYEGELNKIDKLSGELDLSGERLSDDVVGYFAYFKLISGFEKTLYMEKKDVDAWRNCYSKAKSENTPWGTEYDKMAMKTCLRRLISGYGIMTAQMQKAFEYDSAASTSAHERTEQEISEKANNTVIEVNADTGEASVTPADPETKAEPDAGQLPGVDF